ncbi:hypothetical protein BJX64DRAFT_196423 [Aspergillus heterothallicus]
MGLAQLPTEIWILICTDSALEVVDEKNLSLVCWMFRHICAPSILYNVSFPCTKIGLGGLQELACSEIRQYVEYLTYYMPPFYKPPVKGPDTAENQDDSEAALLAEVESIIQQRSEENQCIVKSELDLAALSLALRSLPCLDDLIFTFRKFIPGEQDRVTRKLNDFVAKKKTFEHHISILGQAMSHARANRRHFTSIRLVGVNLATLPDSELLGDDEPSRVALRNSVKQLFARVDCVRLSLSGAIIDLCKETSLDLKELQLLNFSAEYETFKSFLRHNISTIQRIEFYNLQLRNQREGYRRWIQPGFFYKILKGFDPASRIWRRGKDDLNWIFTRRDPVSE